MRKYITSMAIAAVALSATSAVSAQTTQKLTANKTNEYGLIYHLPLTQIDVTVEAERTVRQPGEFFRYSKKYLSIDPVTEPTESWTIKSVTLSTSGVADSEQEYLVQFKSGSTPFILIDQNNFPLTVNAEDYTPQESVALPEAKSAEPTPLDGPAARQAMTEEMLQSKSSAKRAELASSKIFELRQSRNDIISGQADQMPADGKAMQLALDNLSAQEAALTAMFAGTTSVSTEVAGYTFLPDADEQSQRVVIGRLSQTGGLVDSDNLSGAPIYLDVKVVRRGQLPVNDKGEEKRFPKGGLAYRIPGEVKVSVVYEGKTLATKVFEIAQLGAVFGLDPAIFSDKKAPAYVTFDPSTGAIVELGTLN